MMNIPPPAATMSSVQTLRDFINERLTAAAGEIFTVFEQTIVQYEEEIDRQRKLLQSSWEPQIRKRRELPDQHVYQEDLLFNPETSDGLEQEEPPIKEEREELQSVHIKKEQEERGTGQEAEQLPLKPPTDVFVETSTDGQSYLGELEADGDRLLSRQCVIPESYALGAGQHVHPPSNRESELNGMCRSGKTYNLLMSENQSDSDTDESCLKCDACGNTFKCVSQLRQHCAFHSGEEPPSFQALHQATEQRDSSLDRGKSHAGETPFLCNVCGKSLANSSSLKKHARIHTGEKPHCCVTCGKSFGVQRLLLHHLRTHTGEKPYSCEICGKSCSLQSNLLVHMRTHTGEKPYSCETCGNRFGQQSHLLRHIKIHTGERPYSCEMCSKSFSRRSHLLRHTLTHTGEKPYTCGACGKRFSRQCHLLVHQKVHTGENV